LGRVDRKKQASGYVRKNGKDWRNQKSREGGKMSEKIVWFAVIAILSYVVFVSGIIVGIKASIELGKWVLLQYKIIPINETAIMVMLK
jgi:cytochrome b subunit of formate dehydrogenase